MNRSFYYKSFLATFTLLFIAAAHGEGDKVGNGGDAVVCFKTLSTKKLVEAQLRKNKRNPETATYPLSESAVSDIESVEVLDLHLAADAGIGKPNPLITGAGLSEEDIVQDRLAILQTKSTLYFRLQTASRTLSDSRWQKSQSGVLEIDDSLHSINFPEKCLLMQIARQDSVGSFTRLTYDVILFNLLSTVHRAALRFHEWGQWLNSSGDSRASQYMVGQLFRQDFGGEQVAEFNKALAAMNFLGSSSAPATPQLEFIGSERVWATKTETVDPKSFLTYRFEIQNPWTFRGINLPAGATIEQNFEKKFSRLCVPEPTRWQNLEFEGCVKLHLSGAISSITLKQDHEVEPGLVAAANRAIEYDRQGRFYRGTLAYDFALAAGASKFLAGSEIMVIYPDHDMPPLAKSWSEMNSKRTTKSVFLMEDTRTDTKAYTGLATTTIELPLPLRSDQPLSFYEDGSFRGGHAAENFHQNGVSCRSRQAITFYPDGKLRSCSILGNLKLQSSNHSLSYEGPHFISSEGGYRILLAEEERQEFYPRIGKNGTPVPRLVVITSPWTTFYYAPGITNPNNRLETFNDYEFHPSGSIKRLQLSSVNGEHQGKVDGRVREKYEVLTIDENGKVIKSEDRWN